MASCQPMNNSDLLNTWCIENNTSIYGRCCVQLEEAKFQETNDNYTIVG